MANKLSSSVTFYILLALSERSLHGYGIIKQAALDSEGTLSLGAGTLYTAIDRLLKDGLIQKAATPKNEDARRIYYKITGEGKKVLQHEIDTLQVAQGALKKYGYVQVGA